MEKLYIDSNGEQVRYEFKKLLLVLSYLEDHDQEKEFPNQKFVQNLVTYVMPLKVQAIIDI